MAATLYYIWIVDFAHSYTEYHTFVHNIGSSVSAVYRIAINIIYLCLFSRFLKRCLFHNRFESNWSIYFQVQVLFDLVCIVFFSWILFICCFCCWFRLCTWQYFKVYKDKRSIYSTCCCTCSALYDDVHMDCPHLMPNR